MTFHRISPLPESTIDVFSPETKSVISVDSGDTIEVGSLDASGFLSKQKFPGDHPETMFKERRGHCLTGPIEVLGADTSMTLALTLKAIEPADWGWTAAASIDNYLTQRLGVFSGSPSWILWEIDRERGTATSDKGFTVEIAPFLGVMGVPPAETGIHSTIPPRTRGGGNIDCKELTAGSTLYLPVTVPGAMLCLGDGHARQGDGEVGGTAIECSMTTTVQLDLLNDRPVSTIHAVTPTCKITFGFNENLNEASADALNAMLEWMQNLYDLKKADALALASASVDLRVTQVANQVWGVHAVLEDGVIR